MPLNEPETNFDLKNATELWKLESTNKSCSASNSTQSVLGIIANEGDYVYSIISLEPNEATNVTMECPDGTTKALDEAFSYKNTRLLQAM